eukprot:6147765-Alexandrium_andersonii.AAC.2
MCAFTQAARRIKKFRLVVFNNMQTVLVLLPGGSRATTATQDALGFLQWMYEPMAKTLPHTSAPDVDFPSADTLGRSYVANLVGGAASADDNPIDHAHSPAEKRYLPPGGARLGNFTALIARTTAGRRVALRHF